MPSWLTLRVVRFARKSPFLFLFVVNLSGYDNTGSEIRELFCY